MNLTMVYLLYNLTKRELFFQKVVKMAVEKLTLKEQVEKLDKKVKELTLMAQKGCFKTIEDAENSIRKITQTEIELAKKELWEEKIKIGAELYSEPEVIREILEILENELGVNVVLLQKKIEK